MKLEMFYQITGFITNITLARVKLDMDPLDRFKV